ncbi:MAG: hypothetical protein ACW981_17575 [Candidatus Hodarchaeales archaeon]
MSKIYWFVILFLIIKILQLFFFSRGLQWYILVYVIVLMLIFNEKKWVGIPVVFIIFFEIILAYTNEVYAGGSQNEATEATFVPVLFGSILIILLVIYTYKIWTGELSEILDKKNTEKHQAPPYTMRFNNE